MPAVQIAGTTRPQWWPGADLRDQYDELCRLYGVPDGIRLYRGHSINVGAETRWVTD
jgi:hypothetical protein